MLATEIPTAEAPSTPPREHVHLFLEGVRDYAIFMLDPRGHVLSWNQGAITLFGYRPGEIIGQPFTTFFPAEAVRTGRANGRADQAETDGHVEHEEWHVRKDGTCFLGQRHHDRAAR